MRTARIVTTLTTILLAARMGATAATINFTGLDTAAVASASGQNFTYTNGPDQVTGTVNVREITGNPSSGFLTIGSAPDATGFYALEGGDDLSPMVFRFTFDTSRHFTITQNETSANIEYNSFTLAAGSWTTLSASYVTTSESGSTITFVGINGAPPYGAYAIAGSGTAFDFAITNLAGYSLYGSAISVDVFVPPALPPIGAFSESPGGTPVRSSNPWQFTAYYPTIVSGLRLRVQSATTNNIEGSWTDLPDGGQMTDVDGNWALQTTDVPAGTRYFRVIASAPGYLDSPSAAVGPEIVQDGVAPFGFFKWETTYPNETGTLWIFNIDESSVISGLNLRVQANEDGNGWNDLPGGQMTRSGSTWALNTTNLPTGQVSFRVIASAPDYVDRISATLSFTIHEPLPTVMKSSSKDGTFSLSSILDPDPKAIYFDAVQAAVVKFGCSDTVQYNSAVNLAADQYAAAVLQIEKDQNVPILAVNMGQNSTLILKGVITGDVSLISQDGNGIVAQGGGNIVAQGGGNITFDTGTAAIVAQGGGNIVAQGGGNIVAQGGGNIVVSPQATENALASLIQKKGKIQPLDLTQPTFIGQLTINGNYSQFPGTELVIGIAGTNTLNDGAQQFDQLVVSGTANLIGGTIAFGLLDPDDQTNQANVFQPPDGATFDVVVASNVVVGALHILGPIWGDGMFFEGGVVTRPDGLQAVRLMATHIPPRLFLQNAGSALQLVYATNYTGYTVESSPDLVNWSGFSTDTNVVILGPTGSSQFFRMRKP